MIVLTNKYNKFIFPLICGIAVAFYVSFLCWLAITKIENRIKVEKPGYSFSLFTIAADRDATWYYGPRAHDFYEGYLKVSDPHLYETKRYCPPLPPIGAFITGSFVKFYHGNIDQAFKWIRVIFPGIIVFSLFGLFFYITKSYIISLLGAILIFFKPGFASILVDNIGKIIIPNKIYTPNFIKYFTDRTDPNLFFFMRQEAPSVTVIFLLIAFGMMFYAFKNRSLKSFLLLGISIGFLCYVNLYHWLYASILLILVLIIFISIREIKWSSFFIALSGYILVISLWSICLLILVNQPWYEGFKSRIGMEIGRTWRAEFNGQYITAVIFALLSLGIVSMIDKTKRFIFVIIFCFWLSRPILFNLHLLSGQFPHSDHFERYATYFGESLSIIIMLWGIMEIFKNYKIRYIGNILYVFLIGILFFPLCYGISTVNRHVKESWFNYARSNKEYKVYDFINSLTPQGDSILCFDEEIAYGITLYTNCDLYIPPGTSLISNEELLTRYLGGCKLVGTPKDLCIDNMIPVDKTLHKFLWINYFYPTYINSTILEGENSRKVSLDTVKKWSLFYDHLSNEVNDLIKDRRLNFVLITPNTLKFFDEIQLTEKGCKLLFSYEDYKLFKLEVR